jgi:hypothetical protein
VYKWPKFESHFASIKSKLAAKKSHFPGELKKKQNGSNIDFVVN